MPFQRSEWLAAFEAHNAVAPHRSVCQIILDGFCPEIGEPDNGSMCLLQQNAELTGGHGMVRYVSSHKVDGKRHRIFSILDCMLGIFDRLAGYMIGILFLHLSSACRPPP